MDEYRCTRVTGKAWEPHYWTLPEERRGPRREQDEARYPNRHYSHPAPTFDVLCGAPAPYWVRAFYSSRVVRCCSRCLSAVVGDMGQEPNSDGLLPVTVGFIQTRTKAER